MKYVNTPQLRMGLGVMVWIIMIVLSQESVAAASSPHIPAVVIPSSAPNPWSQTSRPTSCNETTVQYL